MFAILVSIAVQLTGPAVIHPMLQVLELRRFDLLQGLMLVEVALSLHAVALLFDQRLEFSQRVVKHDFVALECDTSWHLVLIKQMAAEVSDLARVATNRPTQLINFIGLLLCCILLTRLLQLHAQVSMEEERPAFLSQVALGA